MNVPKKLEPWNNDALQEAYRLILLNKVNVLEKLKQNRRLQESAEQRQKRIDDAIHQWRIDSLLPYAVMVLSESEKALAKVKTMQESVKADLLSRRANLGKALGNWLGNDVAGIDLCSLFIGINGGCIDKSEILKQTEYEKQILELTWRIQQAKATIKEIEALKSLPLDAEETQKRKKATLLTTLEMINTNEEK